MPSHAGISLALFLASLLSAHAQASKTWQCTTPSSSFLAVLACPSVSIVSQMPRFGYATSLSSVVGGGSSDYVSYGIGVGVQFAYGIGLAILTLLVGCCFCWCRCCCNWCGARESLAGGYTKCQRWGAWTGMLVFSLVVAWLAVFGIYSNIQVSQAAVGTSGGIVPAITQLLANTAYFISGAVPQTGNAITSPPLTSLLAQTGAQITALVPTVQALLAQTGIISTGVPAFEALISATGAGVGAQSSVTVGSVSPVTFTCAACSAVASQVSSVVSGINSQTSQSLADMQSAVTESQNALVSQAASISSQVASVQSTLNTASNSTIVPQYQQFNDSYQSKATQYDDIRNIVVLVLLVLPSTALLAVFFGGWCKWGGPFTVAYSFGYFASFLVFLVFAVHLPLSMVMSDSCNYMTSVDSNLAGVGALGEAGKLLGACLSNASLVTTYGLEEKLNFTSRIKLPTIPNLATQFTFSGVTTLTSAMRALNLTSFGYDATTLTTKLADLNACATCTCVKPTFTRATAKNCKLDACYTPTPDAAYVVYFCCEKILIKRQYDFLSDLLSLVNSPLPLFPFSSTATLQ